VAVPGSKRLGVAEILVALVLRCGRYDRRNELGRDLPHCSVDVGVVAPEPPRVVVLGAEPVRIAVRVELPEETHGVVAPLEVVPVEAETVVVGDERAVLHQVVIQGLGERPEACLLVAVVLPERLEETPPGGGDAPLLSGRHELDIGEARHGGLGEGIGKERAKARSADARSDRYLDVLQLQFGLCVSFISGMSMKTFQSRMTSALMFFQDGSSSQSLESS